MGEFAPPTARRLILLGESVDAREAEALDVFDERVPADELMTRALARAQHSAALPPHVFTITGRELRAPSLGRIAEARSGRREPRLGSWLGEEMRRAAVAVLRRAA